jgi:hypothetical protein
VLKAQPAPLVQAQQQVLQEHKVLKALQVHKAQLVLKVQ